MSFYMLKSSKWVEIIKYTDLSTQLIDSSGNGTVDELVAYMCTNLTRSVFSKGDLSASRHFGNDLDRIEWLPIFPMRGSKYIVFPVVQYAYTTKKLSVYAYGVNVEQHGRGAGFGEVSLSAIEAREIKNYLNSSITVSFCRNIKSSEEFKKHLLETYDETCCKF